MLCGHRFSTTQGQWTTTFDAVLLSCNLRGGASGSWLFALQTAVWMRGGTGAAPFPHDGARFVPSGGVALLSPGMTKRVGLFAYEGAVPSLRAKSRTPNAFSKSLGTMTLEREATGACQLSISAAVSISICRFKLVEFMNKTLSTGIKVSKKVLRFARCDESCRCTTLRDTHCWLASSRRAVSIWFTARARL